MQYNAIAKTLNKNFGCPMPKAERLIVSFAELYAVFQKYVADTLKQAAKDGYVTLMFGLRLDTPALKRDGYGGSYAAEAEARSVGNALGQSIGMINPRAAREFINKAKKNPGYRYEIFISNLIHDAIYPIVPRSDVAVAWTKEHLEKAMRWQNHPYIQHDKINFTADMEVCDQSWAEPIPAVDWKDKP